MKIVYTIKNGFTGKLNNSVKEHEINKRQISNKIVCINYLSVYALEVKWIVKFILKSSAQTKCYRASIKLILKWSNKENIRQQESIMKVAVRYQ